MMWTPYLVWGGALAVVVSAIGLGRLFFTAITRTYAGKRLRFEGEVRDVCIVHAGKWVVYLEIEGHRYGLAGYFGKDHYERLLTLNKGDWITIEGKVERLQHGLSLEQAEIIHVGKTPKPRASLAPNSA